VDLKRVVRDRFGVDLSEVSLGRILKQLGFSRISARPQHPMQDPEANLRNNYLGNRVFASYEAILDACQDTWRKLLAETGRSTSIAEREGAMVGHSF
jgi:hypothetical protein